VFSRGNRRRRRDWAEKYSVPSVDLKFEIRDSRFEMAAFNLESRIPDSGS
jgi:hypothetical protein